MKQRSILLAMAVAMLASLMTSSSYAQFSDMTLTTPVNNLHKIPGPLRPLIWAQKDHFSPAPYYAYSSAGVTAQRTHEWNVQQSNRYPWHGNYNYHRWQRPTALVVPPTASFQTEYNWGVGQTRSFPIYHQAGRDGLGQSFGGGGGGLFNNQPYQPSSTSQFGVYPVRGPWHH